MSIGKPGVTEEAIETTKNFIEKEKVKGKSSYFCLLMDEMSIRQMLEEFQDEIYGYVDFGNGAKNDDCLIAKQVLVFMIVSINGNFKIPVAYFFVCGSTGRDKSSFIISLIQQLHLNGLNIICFTFDGAQDNISAIKHLGANINPDDIKCSFTVENVPNRIYISLDNCHMLKLVRNNFVKQRNFIDVNGKQVRWQLIEELVQIQSKIILFSGQ